MGYWGTERLSSDAAMDTIYLIEKSLLEQFNEAYEIGEQLAIADVVISNDQLGSMTYEGGIVRVMISRFITKLSFATMFDETIQNTISELIEKVVKYDLQVAQANASFSVTAGVK